MCPVRLVVSGSLRWTAAFAVAAWACPVLSVLPFGLLVLIIWVGSVDHSLGVHVVVHFLLFVHVRRVVLCGSGILWHGLFVLGMRSLRLISELSGMLVDLHALHVCFGRFDCVFRGGDSVTTSSNCR